MTELPREQGTVSAWYESRKFGFITTSPDSRVKRTFFHGTHVTAGRPRVGARCTFVRLSGDKGDYADRVEFEASMR